MSNLSFENIDRWLFEYTEGNLSSTQIEQLENFLFLHPELNIDLESWKGAKVEKETIAFDALAYQQSAPIFGIIWTTTAIGFLMLALTYSFIPESFMISSKYNQENIDIALIEDLDLEADGFASRIALANDMSPSLEENLSENNIQIAQTNSSERNRDAYKNENSFTKSKNKNIAEVEKINTEQVYSLTDVLVNSANAEINDEYFSKQAPKLDEVVASLSKSKSSNERDGVAEKRTYSYSGKSMTLKKRFVNLGRQVKKMADQPVALRNSKDPHFHAPFMTGYNANFGMVGTLMRNRFQTTTRNQWVGHENQQLMNMISWDNYIYPIRGGLGIDVSYSTYGNGGLENYNAAVTYSPKLSITKNVSLEPALRFKTGMINLDNQSSIIGRDIEFRRQNIRGVFADGENPIGSQLWYRDLGVGMLLNTKWFYAGVNLDNVNRHYSNFYSSDLNADHRASHHLTSIIGTEYTPLGRDLTYSAYALHQQFGELNEVWFGGNVQWNWLQTGAGISNNGDFGASLGITFDQFTIMYNIDYIESRLLDSQLLSHQVTMRFLMRPNRFAAKFLMK